MKKRKEISFINLPGVENLTVSDSTFIDTTGRVTEGIKAPNAKGVTIHRNKMKLLGGFKGDKWGKTNAIIALCTIFVMIFIALLGWKLSGQL